MCQRVPGAGWWGVLVTVLCAAELAQPQKAEACGGLFCSGGGNTTTTSTGIVNQTAERILFIDNADGTISAVIQILYEGPTEKFAWIIPVAGVPDVKVSSGVVLDALQQQTNPSYSLSITRNCPPPTGGPSFGGSCECGNCAASAPMATASSGPGNTLGGGPVVTVEAAGSIGPYDFTVISVQPFALDPARVALDWLTANGFDAGTTAADALRPYLQDGLNLLAFRLTKHADVGSIRPVMITYQAEAASIPIRPTAVAAQEDMGILVFIAGKSRAVPTNYKTVVLDEARINWWKPGSNYDRVVSDAADEAGGQAFVTESSQAFSGFATLAAGPSGQSITLGTLAADFMAYSKLAHDTGLHAVRDAWRWESFDGFDDALTAASTLPSGFDFDTFRKCVAAAAVMADVSAADSSFSQCVGAYAPAATAPMVAIDPKLFSQKLDELVVKPVLDTITKVAAQPHLTRLYTKISPIEMTVDPVFQENADAEAVSNVHVAQGSAPCYGGLATIPLPQGTTIGAESNAMTWPVAADAAPAAIQVLQYGTSGAPKVLSDQTAQLRGAKFGLGACTPIDPGGAKTGSGLAGSGARANGTLTGSGGSASNGNTNTGREGTTTFTSMSNPDTRKSGGCSTSGGAGADLRALVGLLLALFMLRRRARSQVKERADLF